MLFILMHLFMFCDDVHLNVRMRPMLRYLDRHFEIHHQQKQIEKGDEKSSSVLMVWGGGGGVEMLYEYEMCS